MPARRPLVRATAAFAVGALALTGLALAGSDAQAVGASTGVSTRATAAVDSTPGYSIRHIYVPVHIGPHHSKYCVLDADLYIPDGVSPRHRAPAILTTNGFGGSKNDSNESAIGKGFAQQGYIVAAYSGLGFGKSNNCPISLDDPAYDGVAGKQMVDVLAGTRYYRLQNSRSVLRFRDVSMERPGDPRVGMIGGSYGGEIQFAVAEQDPRVDAIIPLITWNDLTYSLAPHNVAKKEWIDLFSADGIASGVPNGTNPNPPPSTTTCPNFTPQACRSMVQLNTFGYPDAATVRLARHASVASYVSRIKVPTLLVQGQADTLFNLNEAVTTYRSLYHQHTPVRMVWQYWGHSDSKPAPGELDFSKSLRDSYLGLRFLRWMNHYVRGYSSAQVGPVFSYFRDWVSYPGDATHGGTATGKDVARAYVTSGTFSEKVTRTLYFGGRPIGSTETDNALTQTRSSMVPLTPTSPSSTYSNTSEAPTSYSETSGLPQTATNPPKDGPGTYVAFTSAALTKDAVMVGSPRLTLHVSSPTAEASQKGGMAGQLVLFAKVYDVKPDGTKLLQHRLIAPLRVADVTKTIHLSLPAVVQKFPAGDKIQVVVAASDMAYAGNKLAQTVTITSSPTAPSSIGLPLR
ncbi:MAG: peptidase S15 [Actinomycetota bacterium]|nr:peptidase S15 [Actinomycetota bacterium]